jgi:hypothetical protein
MNTITRSLVAATALVAAARPSFAHDVSEHMAEAANNFLAALTDEQRARAVFAFDSDERKNWHFIPRSRLGLPIKEMTHEQRLLAHSLLVTGLSSQGYQKATSVMSLEAILAILEKDRKGGPVRDPELYFFSVFGTPGKSVWGWRVEGHHLAFNFTCPGEGVAPALTPSFLGTNPGLVKEGPRKGTRVLGREEDLGRELAKSLSAEQRKKAVVMTEAPKEILNDPKRVDPTKPEGIAASELTDAQKKILDRLMMEYIGRHRPELQEGERKRAATGGDSALFFTWAGGMEPGQPHYYRVQGKTFVVEYDNVQNEANHPHSVWRDFGRDFGVDLLRQHRAAAH